MENETEEAFKGWLGKRVSVPDPRNPRETIGGILTFAGVNELHGKFQVTIGRMPVWPVDRKKVKLQ